MTDIVPRVCVHGTRGVDAATSRAKTDSPAGLHLFSSVAPNASSSSSSSSSSSATTTSTTTTTAAASTTTTTSTIPRTSDEKNENDVVLKILRLVQRQKNERAKRHAQRNDKDTTPPGFKQDSRRDAAIRLLRKLVVPEPVGHSSHPQRPSVPDYRDAIEWYCRVRGHDHKTNIPSTDEAESHNDLALLVNEAHALSVGLGRDRVEERLAATGPTLELDTSTVVDCEVGSRTWFAPTTNSNNENENENQNENQNNGKNKHTDETSDDEETRDGSLVLPQNIPPRRARSPARHQPHSPDPSHLALMREWRQRAECRWSAAALGGSLDELRRKFGSFELRFTSDVVSWCRVLLEAGATRRQLVVVLRERHVPFDVVATSLCDHNVDELACQLSLYDAHVPAHWCASHGHPVRRNEEI